MNEKMIFVLLFGIMMLGLFEINEVFGDGLENPFNFANDKDISKKYTPFEFNFPIIENIGQIDNDLEFYSETFFGKLGVNKNEIVYFLGKKDGNSPLIVKEKFDGNELNPKGVEKSITKFSYFSKANQYQNIPTFNKISLGEIWDLIDVELKSQHGNVEKIFTIKPGGKIKDIRLFFEGSQKLSADQNGELVVFLKEDILSLSSPVAYQYINGERKYVEVWYEVYDNEYGFKIGVYNPYHPLIIDPLIASTYLGGSSLDEASFIGDAVAMDDDGKIFVTGRTKSNDFPLTPPFNIKPLNNEDIFISKFSNDLTTLEASAIISGSARDEGNAIEIDSDGKVFVAGETRSSNFPTTPGVLQETNLPSAFIIEPFILRMNNDLTMLEKATYAGSWISNKISDLEINSPNTILAIGDDRLILIDKNLAQVSNSHLVPGTLTSMTIDMAGNVYYTGWSNDENFPVTDGAYDETHDNTNDPNDFDVVVVKLNSNLAIQAATFLGGSGSDQAFSIDLDSQENVVIGGRTSSSNFPTTNGAFDESYNGSQDGFVAKFNNSLTNLLSSTFLGGSDSEELVGLIIDNSDNIFVTGRTASLDFPTKINSFDDTLDGTSDGYVSKFSNNLNSLVASTYLGGSSNEKPTGIELHNQGILLFGETGSDDFPTTTGAYDETDNPTLDIFVSIIDTNLSSPPCSVPNSGDWLITSSCFLSSNESVPANVIVQDTSLLEIPSGVTLDIDFANFNLTIKSGSGVLIKSGGAIT